MRLGRLQMLLLYALRRHGREATLQSLAAFAASLISDLERPLPPDRVPSRTQYVSVSRAVAALKQRGLVETELVGVKRGRFEWLPPRAGRLRSKWTFQNPTTRLLVRAIPARSEETHEHEVHS